MCLHMYKWDCAHACMHMFLPLAAYAMNDSIYMMCPIRWLCMCVACEHWLCVYMFPIAWDSECYRDSLESINTHTLLSAATHTCSHNLPFQLEKYIIGFQGSQFVYQGWTQSHAETCLCLSVFISLFFTFLPLPLNIFSPDFLNEVVPAQTR